MTVGGRAVGVLVGALVAALLAVLPIAGAQAVEGVVTFPDVQSINPRVTPYSISITDAGGAGHLIALWSVNSGEHREIEVPHEGIATLPFAETFTYNYSTRVTLFRCPSPTLVIDTCQEVDYSNHVSVLIRADMKMTLSEAVGVDVVSVPFTYFPTGVGTTTWRLLAADGSELTTGRTGPGSGGQLALAVPPGTPEQLGVLELRTSLDDTAVGHLDDLVSVPMRLDGVPPPVPTISVSALAVYPYEDHYRDEIPVSVHAPGATSAVLEAVNEATGVAYWVDSGLSSDEPSETFFPNDRRAMGSMLAGNYQLRIVSEDLGGQSSAVSHSIEVRWDRVNLRKWQATVPAAETVIKKYVGSCGKLRRPAEPGWRGSLGYYSGNCRDPKQALVQTIHAIEIPPAMGGAYPFFKVSLIGGPNRKRPGSYVVLGYYTNAKRWKFEHGRVHRGRGVAVRQGRAVRRSRTEEFIHDDGNGPYVAWSAGLTAGSRYDVKSFRVELLVKELVPGSSPD